MHTPSVLIGWLDLLKDRRRPDVGEPHEAVPVGSRGGYRGVQHGRPRAALFVVGDAGQDLNVRPETLWDLRGLQLPPVNRFGK
jgi:hypothetical protein